MAQTIQEANYQYYMESDVSQFSGEWIAVCDNKIISHDNNIKEVVKEANSKSTGKKFLLARVSSEETIIF